MGRRRGTIRNPLTISIIPWPWPYGDEDVLEADGHRFTLLDWEDREPWEILHDRLRHRQGPKRRR